MTATESAATPPPGLPAARATSTTTAIVPARMTLGCGVTSTMKPARASIATTIRPVLRTRQSPATTNAAAVTMAQFAPDTAVR